MAEWQTAVSSGDAAKLSELVCASACSTEQALGLVRTCVEVLEKKVASAGGSLCRCSEMSIPVCAQHSCKACIDMLGLVACGAFLNFVAKIPDTLTS